MTSLIDQIQEDVSEIMGDLHLPHYGKIAEKLRRGPDYLEMRSIAHRCYIKEVTDDNEDFCFSFLVKFSDYLVRLEMSVVGNYFCMMSIRGNECKLVEPSQLLSNDDLRLVFSDISQGRTALDSHVLESRIPLCTDDAIDGKTLIYNALFSSSIIPWK